MMLIVHSYLWLTAMPSTADKPEQSHHNNLHYSCQAFDLGAAAPWLTTSGDDKSGELGRTLEEKEAKGKSEPTTTSLSVPRE